MKKILIISTICAFAFSAEANISTCAVTDDGAGTVTFDICYTSDSDIAGAQFTFDGGASGLSLSGASGGAAGNAGWLLNTSPSGLVLGFSMSGSTVPSSSEEALLVQITGTYNTNGLTDVGPTMGGSDAFATSGAGSFTVSTQVSSWDAGNDSATLEGDLPATYSLGNNFPNPFNPSTTINYNVEEYGNVSIVIYDMTGRQVKELINENVTPQINSDYSVVWDGTNDAGSLVSAGTYICRMVSNDFVSTNKMTLMK